MDLLSLPPCTVLLQQSAAGCWTDEWRSISGYQQCQHCQGYRTFERATPHLEAHQNFPSALSHLLTKGSYLGPGLHGTTPSGTSSYFSVDIGLIHIAVISNAEEHDDRSPEELAWLAKDLETANNRRKDVPWIIV